MTEPQTFDEIEYVVPLGEPSHVHIPRPSRRTSGLIANRDELEVLDDVGGCACGKL